MATRSKFNVQFSVRQNGALEELAAELETTKAEVLKRALALLDIAVREKKSGNHIGVVRNRQEVKEIIGIY